MGKVRVRKLEALRSRQGERMGTRSSAEVTVPPLGREPAYWRPQNPEIFSNAEVRRQTGPYSSAVPLTLAHLALEIPAELQAEAEEAVLALRHYDTYAIQRLGIQHAVLGPMTSILLRTESASSSQIEQLSTSARQLAMAEIGANSRPNAHTVIGNVRAMEAALSLADHINAAAICDVHRELLTRQTGMEDEAGRLRTELVWIGNHDTAGPRGATFIAPQPERVPRAVQDLVTFLQRDDLPALVQTAIAHAQFETIHPFVDGNGRTGRALVQALLREKRVVEHVTVPISAGLLTNLERYFAALTTFRAGDAGPIIREFTRAAHYAATTGRALVDALANQLQDSEDKLTGVRPQAVAWKVLPLLIGQPVINAQYLQQSLNIRDATAQRTLKTLTEHGILVERTGQARNRVWQHPGILNVLDAYAAQIRRPATHS